MTPEKIKLNLEEGSLLLEYADGSRFTLTGEYLRVHSPARKFADTARDREYCSRENMVSGSPMWPLLEIMPCM